MEPVSSLFVILVMQISPKNLLSDNPTYFFYVAKSRFRFTTYIEDVVLVPMRQLSIRVTIYKKLTITGQSTVSDTETWLTPKD